MSRASLFGDPHWLHTPNPALADRLEQERGGFGHDWSPAEDDPQPKPCPSFGDQPGDPARRAAELDAAMHPRRAA